MSTNKKKKQRRQRELQAELQKELLKYDDTTNIKVVFNDSYKSSLIDFFSSKESNFYSDYFSDCISDNLISVSDVNSFIYALNDKLFLHSLSMLEIIYYLSSCYDLDLYFEYDKRFFTFSSSFFDSDIKSFHEFIFTVFISLKSVNSFYTLIRSAYKDFYSSLRDLSHDSLKEVICNDNNLILHFKYIYDDVIISIDSECLSCEFSN